MSGYARAAHALGAQRQRLRRAPLARTSSACATTACWTARIGHDAANVPAGEDVEVVYSSAVPAENPERRRRARARPAASARAPSCSASSPRCSATIAVAGTHGKTTTACDARPRAARAPGWTRLADRRRDRRRAAERALERRRVAGRRGRRVRPLDARACDVEIAVLTNVELDHHATSARCAELREAFRAFLARARRGRRDLGPAELLARRAAPRRRPRGRRPTTSPPPLLDAEGSRFRLARARGRACAVPGAHNALNAAAALEAARLAGAPLAGARSPGLADFRGAGTALSAARRQRRRGAIVRRLRAPSRPR